MDLGKVTVFSGSPQQQSSPTLPTVPGTSLYLQLVLQLDDMAVLSAAQLSRKPGRRSPSCAKMTPANPTMKGLEL